VRWKSDNVVSKLMTWNRICDGSDVDDDSDVISCLWLESCKLNLSHG